MMRLVVDTAPHGGANQVHTEEKQLEESRGQPATHDRVVADIVRQKAETGDAVAEQHGAEWGRDEWQDPDEAIPSCDERQMKRDPPEMARRWAEYLWTQKWA